LALMGAIHAAGATMPLTLWRGVDRLVVSCSPATGANSVLHMNLCREVVREAGRGSPYPVVTASQVAQPTARDVVLQVEVAADGTAGLSFRILPVRDDPRAETAAMPRHPSARPARVTPSAGAPDLKALVAGELDRILPWRSQRGRSRG
jgi:hypothetical protein